MKNNIFKNKQFLGILFAIIAFAVITLIYFTPILEGKRIQQHDIEMYKGMAQEINEFRDETGEQSLWTNSMFGGMPAWNIGVKQNSNLMTYVQKIIGLGFPSPIMSVFISMLGFFILLLVLECKIWVSFIGALAYGFTSYLFIVMGAGHNSKAVAMAYMAPVIAGIIMTYKGKYLWGAVLTAISLALEIRAGHIQITYYLFMIVLIMVIAEFVEAIKSKKYLDFFKASGILVVVAVLAVMTSTTSLYANYEFGKETMRGKPVLVENTGNQTRGLDRDYVTQWSYGIGETFSLLVPNVKGGASVPLAANEKAMEKANPMYGSIYSQLGQYWGEQPGTSGPVYVGAFVMFLFVLALFIVKTPMKWALLAATILSILLSWGKNFMGFTDFFIDYVPMYNKFRAVSSILVIAEFTIPLLAMLGLKEVVSRPKLLQECKKEFLISFALTGGLALLFAVVPTVFFPSYVSTMEMNALQSIPTDQLVPLLANLEEVRKSLFTSDAWRSFFIILIGAGLVWAYGMGKLKQVTMVACLAVLCLVDMWDVNKRYLYDDQFVEKQVQTQSFRQSETDKLILEDEALDYRVLNLASNTFNENNTAYWHKSVGGYHAAKLRRYQEMIEAHISGEMNNLFKAVADAGGEMEQLDPAEFPVLNMLNTRYFIFPLQGGQTVPLYNPFALGNAWFVDEVQYVSNANEEIEAIHDLDPLQKAVVDKKFEASVRSMPLDSTATIELVEYQPNYLKYEVNSEKGGTVVFSEIYYPGWQSVIDGQEIPHGRANYILRAMNVPAGKHVVEFKFDPKSLHTTETIAFIALGLLALLAIFVAYKGIKNKM